MQYFIADFHIHSKYSRATSKNMDMENLSKWAKIKGISLLGTGDFTHPDWLKELKEKLEPAEHGLYKHNEIYYILTTEVANIYFKFGKSRKIHNIIFAPSFKDAGAINRYLSDFGDLKSDGRPMLDLDCEKMVRALSEINPDIFIIPAHCLLPNALVHTSKGVKPIKDISKKDYVYTHKRRFKKVTKLFQRKYIGEIFHIKPYYFREGIRVTPEHPFYIIKTYKNCPSRDSFCMPNCSQLRHKGCKRKFFNQYHIQWVQAKDVEIDDVVVFPRFNNRTIDKDIIKVSEMIPSNFILRGNKIGYKGTRTNFIRDDIKIGNNFCRLAGYFVSEGYTNSRDCISFCFLEEEKEYIKDVIALVRKIFGIKLYKTQFKNGVKGIELIFYSKVLCKLFSRLFYTNTHDKRAYSKSLPNWMLKLPLRKQVEIIKSWWRGDRGYTVSHILMNQMKVLFLRLGIIPSIGIDSIQSHKKRGKHFIGLRKISSQHDTFNFSNLSFFNDRFNLLKDKVFAKFKTKSPRRHGWIDDNYVYLPVRNIVKEKYIGTVYNLEIENDNSYVCEFATVHNCWTPWFSLFGSNSGFDNIEDCFEQETSKIFALETGLSSDPLMNWRWSKLDRFCLISNSDSHSPSRLGREANVFKEKFGYKELIEILKKKDKEKFLFTVEFFPEEGKYHWDGHRNCKARLSPKEAKKINERCPVCGRRITVGVMHRLEDLADRDEGYKLESGIPFKNLVSLDEIIAEAMGVGKETTGVQREYNTLIQRLGSEFKILLEVPEGEILKNCQPRIAKGILKVRKGEVGVLPGYDGEYGQVKILTEEDKKGEKQLSFF